MGCSMCDHFAATRNHVRVVQRLMLRIAHLIIEAAMRHDDSKYDPEEASLFAAVLPRLRGSTYGSDEYRSTLREIRPAIEHHNRVNAHHPEHFANGIDGMSLVNLVEMICDWKAATLRHADGDIERSIEVNRDRFEMTEQLCSILKNTVDRELRDALKETDA